MTEKMPWFGYLVVASFPAMDHVNLALHANESLSRGLLFLLLLPCRAITHDMGDAGLGYLCLQADPICQRSKNNSQIFFRRSILVPIDSRALRSSATKDVWMVHMLQ